MPIVDGGSASGLPVIPSFAAETEWMAGTVTSYNPTTGALVFNSLVYSGTTSSSSWDIHRAPYPGSSSQLLGTSTSTHTPGTGSKSLSITTGLDLVAGEYIYVISSAVTGMNATGMILYLAALQLQDETGQQWDNAVLVPYINLFLLETMNLKPEAYPTVQNISLVAGAVQSIPATAISLIDIVCNMGTAGTTRGAAIDAITKEALDALIPGWMSYTAATDVEHYVRDDRNPRRFYVFPPQPVTPTKVEAILHIPPTPITEEDGTFPFDNSYIPAAIDYVIYRALVEETTIPNAQAKAAVFYQKFLQDLGLKTNTEKQTEAKG